MRTHNYRFYDFILFIIEDMFRFKKFPILFFLYLSKVCKYLFAEINIRVIVLYKITILTRYIFCQCIEPLIFSSPMVIAKFIIFLSGCQQRLLLFSSYKHFFFCIRRFLDLICFSYIRGQADN